MRLATLEPEPHERYRESMRDITLSFIICTYNRAPYLRRLVLSLLAQTARYKDLEIIVVDNNSVDDTRTVIDHLARRDLIVRYVRETKQGLSNARNGGAAIARGEYLLFLDDDALTPEGFVDAMRSTVHNHKPDLFGGPIYPLYADPRPDWFPERLEVREKAKESGFHAGVTISGGNFGIRADVLDRLGGFDPRFGMTGSKVGMLEERLVVDKYKTLTPARRQKIYYDLDAWLLHHTPWQRMTMEFQKRRIYLADYQSTLYTLSHGMRDPVTYFLAQAKRTVNVFLNAFPEIATTRGWLSEADTKRAHQRIRLVHATAKAHAAYSYAVLGARTEIEQLVAPEDCAPMRLLWVRSVDPRSVERRWSREDKLHAWLEEAWDNDDRIEVHALRFKEIPNNKELWAALENWGMNSVDIIVFEDRVPSGIGELLRTYYPLMQVIAVTTRARYLDGLERAQMAKVGELKKDVGNDILSSRRRDDRDTRRFAHYVVSRSQIESRRYWPKLRGGAEVRYAPPVTPVGLVRELRESHEGKIPTILCPGEVQPSPISTWHAKIAASAFTRDRLDKDGWTLELSGKVKGAVDENLPGVKVVGLHKGYPKRLARATALLFMGEVRLGQPTRFFEAVAAGTPIIAPKGTIARVDPRLAPWIIEFEPRKAGSLRAAVEAAAEFDTSKLDADATLDLWREDARCVWSAIIEECKVYAMPRMRVDETRPQDKVA